MGRVTAALGGVISILLAGCSTIVKGTDQQVSVNTPGVPGAMCQLQSPGIGTRMVQTPKPPSSAEGPCAHPGTG